MRALIVICLFTTPAYADDSTPLVVGPMIGSAVGTIVVGGAALAASTQNTAHRYAVPIAAAAGSIVGGVIGGGIVGVISDDVGAGGVAGVAVGVTGVPAALAASALVSFATLPATGSENYLFLTQIAAVMFVLPPILMAFAVTTTVMGAAAACGFGHCALADTITGTQRDDAKERAVTLAQLGTAIGWVPGCVGVGVLVIDDAQAKGAPVDNVVLASGVVTGAAVFGAVGAFSAAALAGEPKVGAAAAVGGAVSAGAAPVVVALAASATSVALSAPGGEDAVSAAGLAFLLLPGSSSVALFAVLAVVGAPSLGAGATACLLADTCPSWMPQAPP